jgi:nucleotidyltransferase substrate binding protein (TIGR01987 family)
MDQLGRGRDVDGVYRRLQVSLNNAIAQLATALRYAQSAETVADPGLAEQLRNSVIHCFEVTYELSHKMLKRHLECAAANPDDVGHASFQRLIRMGNDTGLLRSDWAVWRTYRQARTECSQAYDQAKAQAVFALTAVF